MPEIILYIAVSQDGFIADKNGSTQWLDKYNEGPEDYKFYDFYGSVDALVFGKNTYNQLLTFGNWPFPDKTSYVFGDQETEIEVDPEEGIVELVDIDIQEFIKKLDTIGIKRVWLMGGAQLVESFDKLGLIDEYIIATIPEKLGEGIPLPATIVNGQNLELVETINYPVSGVVQKFYKKKK